MKLTLLDMTQTILSALNSDEVNSIGDTPESLQVAQCIKNTYLNMLGKYEFPENVGPINLTPSDNEDQPTLMFLPSGTARVEWIKYYNSNPFSGNELQTDQFGAYSHDVNVDLQNNAGGGTNPTAAGYQDVYILPMQEFFQINAEMNASEDNVGSFTLEIPNQATSVNDAFTIFYENDRQPRHCTIIRNYYLLFDSYDNTQDSTLQSSKVMCQAWIDPIFELEDNFIPYMDDKHFPLLLNDAKSLAFTEIKNQPHPKAEKETDKQLFSLMKWKAQHDTPSYFGELPDFGRRGPGGFGWGTPYRSIK